MAAPDPFRVLPWAETHIDVWRGATKTVTVDFDGEDVSSYTYAAHVADVPGDDGTALATFTVDATAAASGTVVLSLSTDDTATLPDECVWAVLEDGSPLIVGTVVASGPVAS